MTSKVSGLGSGDIIKGNTNLTESSEMDKTRRLGKTDRIARLLLVIYLLYQHRHEGLLVEEIARQCAVSTRTTRRDLAVLESLGFPIWEERSRPGSKRGIGEGFFLPPIYFSLPEVLNIFLASRLLLHHAHRYDASVASTFQKLNCIVPAPLRYQIQKTMDWMQKQPKDDKYLHALAAVAEAWISQRRAKIFYKALHKNEATERIIEPYFIEPANPGHSTYVIAYCHRTNSIRTFKIERIQSIELLDEQYRVPDKFDANEYLGSSWGIVAEGKVKTIKLRFAPNIARIVEETIWHPSQIVERQSDGSVIMTLRITDTIELHSWLLGWGEKVEVLEPEELRQQMIKNTKAILDVYQQKR